MKERTINGALHLCRNGMLTEPKLICVFSVFVVHQRNTEGDIIICLMWSTIIMKPSWVSDDDDNGDDDGHE